MAIDFMTALRERARAQERGARLSGRPLTQAETAAPYVAMADTAGDRNARGRALQLQEQAQTTQAGQFGQTLEFNKTTTAENQRLERERLSESSRAEAARMAFQREQMGEQLDAADKALTRDYVQSGLGLAGNAYMVSKLFGGGNAGGITGGATTAGPYTTATTAGTGGALFTGSEAAEVGAGAAGVGATAAESLAASSAAAYGAGYGAEIGAGGAAAAGGAEAGAAMGAGAAAGGAAAVAALPILAYAFNTSKAKGRQARMEADPVWQAGVVTARTQENQAIQEFAQLQTPEQRAAYIASLSSDRRNTVINRSNNAGILTPAEYANLLALHERLSADAMSSFAR